MATQLAKLKMNGGSFEFNKDENNARSPDLRKLKSEMLPGIGNF